MRSLLLVFVIILTSCQLDADKKIDRNKFTFKIGTDTQLFFKNMRQSYYDYDQNSPRGINVFRYSNKDMNDTIPVLNLAIILNYLNDEAYLLLEPNNAAGSLPINILSINGKGKIKKEIRLEKMNRETMLNFAANIYEEVLRGNDFVLTRGSTQHPILQSRKQREAFRITVSDYFRLTRVY